MPTCMITRWLETSFRQLDQGEVDVCMAIDEMRKESASQKEAEVRKQVAIDLLKEGIDSVSFVSKISKLSEDAVRRLAKTIGIAVVS